MKIRSNQVSRRLSAAALGALLLAPGLAAAQSSLDMTLTTTYGGPAELHLGSPRPAPYSFSTFTETTQYSTFFGPEISLSTSGYVGTAHDSSAAFQGIVIPDAEAAVFNQFLTRFISPNISVAQIASSLSGTSQFSISDSAPVGSGSLEVATDRSVSASTGSPFYSDGTYTYTANYAAEFYGNLTQDAGTAPSFTDMQAVNWLDQMNVSNWSELTVNSCAGTQCVVDSLTLYGGSTVAVAPVPEADALALSLLGLGFVGFAMSRRRSVRKV